MAGNSHQCACSGLLDKINDLPLRQGEIKTTNNFIKVAGNRSFHKNKLTKYFPKNHSGIPLRSHIVTQGNYM